MPPGTHDIHIALELVFRVFTRALRSSDLFQMITLAAPSALGGDSCGTPSLKVVQGYSEHRFPTAQQDAVIAVSLQHCDFKLAWRLNSSRSAPYPETRAAPGGSFPPGRLTMTPGLLHRAPRWVPVQEFSFCIISGTSGSVNSFENDGRLTTLQHTGLLGIPPREPEHSHEIRSPAAEHSPEKESACRYSVALSITNPV